MEPSFVEEIEEPIGHTLLVPFDSAVVVFEPVVGIEQVRMRAVVDKCAEVQEQEEVAL